MSNYGCIGIKKFGVSWKNDIRCFLLTNDVRWSNIY